MTTTTSATTATASTTAANVVSAMGAGSGIDTKSLASSLIAAEKAPRENAINKNITKNESLVSGFAAVKYALNNLKTAFDDLKDRSDFKTISATNSNTSAFTATTTTGADTGSHTVLVNSLAAAQRNTGTLGFAKSTTAINSGSAMSLVVDIAQSSTGTAGFASSTTSINAGESMTLTFGGTAFSSGATVSVAAGDDTPAGIVDAINNAGLSVTASLVNTGDAATPYKVVVTGTAGSDYAFTLSSSASGFNFDTTIKSASTSTITIDAGSDTPAGVVDAVNNSGTGMTAQLVNTGDASTPYKVVLTGASGKYNAFSVTSSVSTLNFATTLQTASDASLTVDGIAISSSSSTTNGG